MTVNVRGAGELEDKLSGLVRDLAGGGLDTELESAGQTLARDEATRAPRATGFLAGSAEVRMDDHVAKITLTAPYAPPVVAGVAGRGIAARPFVDEAAAASDEAIARAVSSGVSDLLKRHGLT